MERVSTYLKDELAPEMPRLAQPMGIGCLGQAIELDLGRAYGACLKQLSDAFEVPAVASDRSTAKDFCATSPPTVSKTASQPVTTAVKSLVL